MATDTFSVSGLRAQATALRARADELDAAATVVEGVLANLVVPFDVEASLQRVRVRLPATRSRESANRGKPPGTLNMTWRENFARIAEVSGRDEFPLDLVRDVVRERTGKDDVKLSHIRRQFNGYVDHDYVTSGATDKYRLTDKLLKLIGYQDSGSNGRDENEASVADATDASETALHALIGRPQE